MAALGHDWFRMTGALFSVSRGEDKNDCLPDPRLAGLGRLRLLSAVS